MYIGHLRGDGQVQSVRDHLEGVALRAERFGEAFGAGPHAYRTGLLHDVGKYAPDVQRRMADPEHTAKVNHTSAGAIEALSLRDMFGAFAIAGHHGGLSDIGSLKVSVPQDGTLWGKLRYRPQLYSAYRQEVRPQPGQLEPAWIGMDKLCASFYTRMLFSCLVDADFLDTEQFMQPDAPRGGGDDMRALLSRLNAYVEPWYPAKTLLNEKRCEILDRCRSMGSGERGLYTLTVPTGGGKTVSSLAFALSHAVAHGLNRVIYVAPYTSIIEQNAAKFAEILGEHNVLEHHSGVDYDEAQDEDAAGSLYRKRLATENWDAPVVVTTAVQFYESLYAAKTSRCRKLHNIAQSVIILDEAQTTPLEYLKPCVYAIAELVRHYGATAVLCTATQPALGPLFDECAPGIAIREIMEDPEALYDFFRRVTFADEGRLSEQELAARLNASGQALCVVNTRKRAQAVFDMMEEDGRFHLSTLMTPDHRRRVVAKIRQRLREGEPCRVVSTSLIEAGVDVDFPTVWREKAGLDSILQAAGRCNREGKRLREDSLVHVFTVDERTIPAQRRQLDALRLVEEVFEQIDDLQAVALYSRALIQSKGEFIDKKGILPACARFDFRTVGDSFKLIETDTVPVYIPTEGNAPLLDALRSGHYDRRMIRRLQRDSVNVYRDHAMRLAGAGKAEQTQDGFLILADMTVYHPEKGLLPGEETGQAVFI